mgnify:CR=1 FL=1
MCIRDRAERGWAETRILIATDVLSEGLNLQDATRLINYDLHWNPVRLMPVSYTHLTLPTSDLV